MKKVIIPNEVAGELRCFIKQPKVQPTVVDERDMEHAIDMMANMAARELVEYQKQGEYQARWWARRLAFGEHVARKHGQRYASMRQVQEAVRPERKEEATYRAFSALKGGVK